jgi:hypothetical protein
MKADGTEMYMTVREYNADPPRDSYLVRNSTGRA